MDGMAEITPEEDEPGLPLGIHPGLVGLDHDGPPRTPEAFDVGTGAGMLMREVAGGLEPATRDGGLDHNFAIGKREGRLIRRQP